MPVKTNFYLVVKAKVDERGNIRGKPTVRTTAKSPSLDSDEVCVHCEVSLPVSLFQAPQLKAQIAVPDAKVTPQVLPAEVASNIADIIREQTGLIIRLTADPESGVRLKEP